MNDLPDCRVTQKGNSGTLRYRLGQFPTQQHVLGRGLAAQVGIVDQTGNGKLCRLLNPFHIGSGFFRGIGQGPVGIELVGLHHILMLTNNKDKPLL